MKKVEAISNFFPSMHGPGTRVVNALTGTVGTTLNERIYLDDRDCYLSVSVIGDEPNGWGLWLVKETRVVAKAGQGQ